MAYFGTQDQIFQFRRDQTSFIILFLVMVLIVNLWICLQRIACCLFERTRMAKQLHLWLVSHELAGIILFGSSPKAPGRPEVITLDEVDLQQSSKDRQVV